MSLTDKLKKWACENCDVKDDADEATFRKAIAEALTSGDLGVAEYAELSKEEGDDESNEFAKDQKKTNELLGELVAQLKAGTDEGTTAVADPPATTATNDPPAKSKDRPPSRMSKMMATMGGLGVDENPDDDGERSVDVRVKAAVESYDASTKALHYPERTKKDKPHPFAGKRVTDMGRALSEPSEQDMALAGVWAKFQLLSIIPRFGGSAQRAWEALTPHEKCLLGHLVEHEQWDDSKIRKPGMCKGYPGGGGVKQLIDDAVSGGLEAAPIVFDDIVIETPLLFGELFPMVNVVTLDRGRRIEGVETGTVTGGWGGVDDAAIPLFNTAAYVSAFDTTIFRWEGAILIGLDFISDTPIDFGSHITRQYGERFLEDLDDVIAAGDGTTQPEGIINKTGITSIAFGGTTTLGNYEALRFGVAKPEHKGPVGNSAVFCGTETSYRRARAIPVGATDARRIFGMDYSSYRIMERDFKINETLTNAQIFYAIMARYRMYRRKGFSVRTSTEGQTLIRNNEMIIVVMARYGGQLERGAAGAITTDAPV